MKKTIPFVWFLLVAIIFGCERESMLVADSQASIDERHSANQKNSDDTPCPYLDDRDCDSFADNVDNCPDVYNPGQEDTDLDGIGDVCDSGGGTPPPQLTGYVSAKTYYDNYCAIQTNPMTYQCGLARGISEALAETKDIFANSVVYVPVTKYYKISGTGSTNEETTAQYCDTAECYITIRSVASDFAMRQSNVSYLTGKLAYIDDLITNYPQFTEYYNAYKAGCSEAFWFSNSSLPVFQIP